MVRRKTLLEDRLQDAVAAGPALKTPTAEALRALHDERLRVLESDNYFSVRAGVAEETFELEEDEVVAVGLKKKVKKVKTKRRVVKSLAQIIREGEYDTWPPHIPNYTTVAAGPPRTVPRHFCTVCGFFSDYTCDRCGMRYCSEKCLVVHRETRCLKFVG